MTPMYVDQSREALDPEKTLYDEIAEGSDEVRGGGSRVEGGAVVRLGLYDGIAGGL